MPRPTASASPRGSGCFALLAGASNDVFVRKVLDTEDNKHFKRRP